MPTAVPLRQAADSCPGALQVHEAADGGLARVRIPGGVVSLTQWHALADFAPLELTSRANLQIRGVRDADALAARLADVGLLPSATHERVRNIVASPLGGVFEVVRAVDRALCASAELADLPGRFLFAIDTDRDVVSLGADVTVLLGGHRVPVLLAGVDSGLRVRPEQAVPVLIAAARCFLFEREAQASKAWRLSELDDGVARTARRLQEALACELVEPVTPGFSAPALPIGVLGGAVGVVVPLGRLTAAQMAAIASVARGEIIVTPWRGVVLPGAGPEALATLADAGLVTDPTSAWATASACTGLPGCAKSRADVRSDASVALGRAQPALASAGAAGGTPDAVGAARQAGWLPVHFVGCERRCGRPAGVHVDVLATTDGYQVDGEPVTVDELPAAVAAARRTRR